MTDICRNYHKGADTSVAAYESTPSKVRAKRRLFVLNTLREMGDATSDEIEAHLDWTHQSVSPRLTELKRDGLIEDTGKRRPTRLGKTARVYTAVDEA